MCVVGITKEANARAMEGHVWNYPVIYTCDPLPKLFFWLLFKLGMPRPPA